MNLIHRMLELFRPTPMERTPEAQARVDQETARLSLYFFPSCPFCIAVRRQIRRLGLTIEERNIHQNRAWAEELGEQGGVVQVPCLRITQPDGEIAWLYESADIVKYLQQRYG